MPSLISRFRPVGFAALVTAASIFPASAKTLGELAQETHYHGISFDHTGKAALLLASHHGLFAVGIDGTVTRISPSQDFMGFSPDPANPLSYFASGHPAAGGSSGFLQSQDGGATWKQLSEGANGPVDFHQMDVSPVDPKTVYGNYMQMQVSRDGGATWQVSGESLPGLIAIAASASRVERIYAATETGLYSSDDAGANWKPAGFQGEVVSLVKVGPDGALYAFVLGKGLMKGHETNPDTWSVVSNGFGKAIPLHLAIDPKDSRHLVLTTQNNDVLETLDGGGAWRAFGTNTP